MLKLKARPRRLRKNSSVRGLVAQTEIQVSNLVLPIFLKDGKNLTESISTLPGIFRFSLDQLLSHIETSMELGIKSFALFPAIEASKKSPTASEAFNPTGLNQQGIKTIKKAFPEVVLFTDVALDPYNSDGHDGLVKSGEILNDETVTLLQKMALAQAEAGTDFVACSDMMDGRVGAIRQALDSAGFQSTSILSYTAKYASSFYGPFRDALNSAPKAGDKKTYQMDFRNRTEAIRELKLDLSEGADMVMVKPALSYLDIISDIKKHASVPVAAYNVSGEYAMIKLAAEKKLLNEDAAMAEVLTSIKRAGADIIFTYHASRAAEILKERGTLC